MESIDTYGTGQGMMQGLEMFRRHKREDEQDQRASEQHGLNMEVGNLRLEQAGLDLEAAKEDRPLVRRQLERNDRSGEIQARAQEISNSAQQAIQRAMGGDINALNEFSMSINPGNPAPPMVMPSDKDGMVKFRDANGKTEELPLRDILERTAQLGRPDYVMEKLLAGSEQQYGAIQYVEGVGYGQYDENNQFNQFRELKNGAGGKSGFGGYNKDTLNYYRQKSADFWGKMNPDGTFFIPEEARKQRDQAEQRMAEFESIGLGPQIAARYGNLSVLPVLTEQDATRMAQEEAAQMNITDEWGPANSLADYLEDRIPQLIDESKEAHEIYQQITGGGFDAAIGVGGEGDAPRQGMGDQSPGAPAAPAVTTAPKGAVDYLRSNNTPEVQAQFKAKYGYLPAPDQAVQYLLQNNSPELRSQFQSKYGYLPEGL